MKKWSAGKIIGVVFLTLVLLVVVGVAALFLFFPPQKIKSLVIPPVEKALGRTVEIEKAGFTLYPNIGVSLSGIEISNTTRPGFSSDPFARLEEFNISINVASIFKGRPEIGKIIISGPQILLETDSAGSFNYADIKALEKDSSASVKAGKKSSGMPMLPVPMTLKKLVIENGVFVYNDRKSGQQFTIGDIDYDLRLSIDKALREIKPVGDLRLSQVSVKTKEISKPLSKLSLTLNHDLLLDLVAGNLSLNQFRFTLQKLALNFSGSVSGLNDNPQLDISMDSDPVAIQDLLAEIPVEIVPVLAKLSASGTADLALTLRGALGDGNMPVQGSLKLNNVMVKYTSLPKSINGLTADIAFTDNSLQIKELKMQFGANPVSLKASVVNFKKPIVDALLTARLDLLDFKDVIELPSGAALSGIVETDVTAKGEVDPSDPLKLDMKGNAFFKNVSVLWPPLVKPAVINGNFTLSSKAIGENLDVKIGRSSASMSASISNYLSLIFKDNKGKNPRTSADFKISSSMLDIDEFMPSESKKTDVKTADAKAAESKNVSGSNNSSSPLIAPLPGVDLRGTINAVNIIYKGIRMQNLATRINVVSDVADLDAKCRIGSGSINEKIHLDIRNIDNIQYQNNLSVSGVEVGDLLTNVGLFLSPTSSLNKGLKTISSTLSGKINLRSNLAGHGQTSEDLTKNMKGEISFNVSNGKISNSLIVNRMSGVVEKFVKIDDITFRDFSALMKIKDERVFFETFKIQSNTAGDFEVKGNVGFDASLAAEIDNRLSKQVSSKVLSLQSGGKDALKGLLKGTLLAGASSLIDQVGIPADNEGRVTLRVGLQGTASNPKASFLGFGSGKAASGAAQPTVKQQVTEKVKDVVEQKKQELKTQVTREVEKAEEKLHGEIQKKAPGLDAEVKKQEEQLKKNVSKLKKLF